MKYISNYNQYITENFKNIVFNDNDNETVTKKFNIDHEYDLVLSYFGKHPDVFPVIYDIDYDNKIVKFEKLYTKKAENEYNNINKYFKNMFGISFHKYLTRNVIPKEWLNTKDLNNLKKVSMDNIQSDIKILVNKYDKLINSIYEIVGKHTIIDIHSKNFGYDKRGNLKMFDI